MLVMNTTVLNLLNAVTGWCQQHPWAPWLMLGLSGLTLVATFVIVPVVIVRIPSDYFVKLKRSDTPWEKKHHSLQIAVRLGKNLLGLALLLVGILLAMPLVPGPGVLTMLLGLALLDVPGKRRLERWIVSRPKVFSALNRLRAKHGQSPLDAPQ